MNQMKSLQEDFKRRADSHRQSTTVMRAADIKLKLFRTDLIEPGYDFEAADAAP